MKVNGQSGFSLLELVMAVLLTVGLLGAVFMMMSRNQEVYVGESNVTDMNQNIRVAMDMLTRDLQTAGMGLPRPNSSFASIYYTEGANNAPDSLLIINGDPFAPAADVDERPSGGGEFLCSLPPDVVATGSGSSVQFSYIGKDKQLKPIYRSYSADPRFYICYDDTKARLLSLTQAGTITGEGATQQLRLLHNQSNYKNPAGTFGSALDTGEPEYGNAKIALLGSMTTYRLNSNSRELERTEDLNNWYTVARGITNFQIQYRIISRDAGGNLVESVTSAPADRKNIRAVEITISAETPDLMPSSKGYRQATHRFEVAPRNLNLLNNTNLSSNLN